ncbi:MAG: hypothetical protein PHY43_01090 [Verrucomicrobiales bacterium]|nr:hypothetical protein [Verrucomicrobiales bacterium]
MNWRVIIRPNAEADLSEAQAWYESRRAGYLEETFDVHEVHTRYAN